MNKLLAMLIAASALSATPALAGPEGEQGQVRKELRAGNILSIRQIEEKILPTMAGAQYLGPEYDSTALAYRLKFIRDGRVLFVDVDARTGDVIRQTR
ncbi:MAG: PepSY domain-containing protein [Proteobacteria bacterium]|nr:PepSY domain-containing protein [Pseudomonadota bacterium]